MVDPSAYVVFASAGFRHESDGEAPQMQREEAPGQAAVLSA